MTALGATKQPPQTAYSPIARHVWVEDSAESYQLITVSQASQVVNRFPTEIR